jgi:transcriptional regulator with XRE-family HTH domain
MSNRSANKADTEIGRRLRLLRIERGLSQDELGSQLGISFQQVQKYEKGTNRMSAGRLAEVAKILKTSPHDLIGWESKIAVAPIDVETYKLARAFEELKDEWKGPVRLLINAMMRVS